MAWQPPQKPGDTDPLISDAKAFLARYSYGKGLGTTDEYTPEFGVALRQFGANVHDQVVKGRIAPPDVNDDGVFDWAIKTQMKLLAPPAPVKPRGPRIPTYVFRGTGGIIGQDIVSRVCQRLGDLVEEINTPWAATMGGIPVGATQGGIGAPSMWTAIQAGLAAAQGDFLARYRVNPNLKICIIGYSAGAILAQLFREWILKNFPQCYVASATFGDPTRPENAAFFGQIVWGNGVADFTLGDPRDYRHAWCTHEKDIYAQIPGGTVGKIMELVYALVAQFAFSDLLKFAGRMIAAIPQALELLGISAPTVVKALNGGVAGIFGFGLQQFILAMGGLIPLGVPDERLTGTAAAARAAVLGLEFLFAGTAPHIRYDFDPAWINPDGSPGPTFTDFAVMHFRDYIGRLAVAA